VLADLEPSRAADVAGQPGQDRVSEPAAVEVLDPPAALADQMVMMPGELLPEFVSTAAAGRVRGPHGVRRPNEAEPHEEVNRAVHGHDVRPAAAEALVNLRHGERLAALREHIEHGAAWARQTQTSTREEVR
jgi:hypothetical protein